ncbi:hypothetical protein PB2503_12829 [Parvularcula bermudensis HTCC2503]|uniref:Uncharacterized protein n=1 Tax=Parvularcula bermudensis (strain ATCC BAA-594 / HTCC2503 / KCTC 12087) TaxID=314260 RepID=E0TG32_PARBH|nr:hypothetical protein [Parvularcula bermudensis]ADM10603.1 hypothetical protein PB2503_12829 [Parvularcula bermudensis HTCC2503]
MMTKKLISASIAGATLFATAVAAPVGTAVVEGDALVLRANETVALSNGADVFANDRVIAQNGSASISAFGCTAVLEQGMSVTVSADMCDAQPVSLGAAQMEAPGLPTIAVATLMLATPAIVAAAVDDDDDDDEEVSPE